MDMDIIKRFIFGAKEAYEKVDNHSFNFLITIESAYRLATNIEKLLKEQETTDTNDLRIFHCKKCGYGIDDIFISDEHNYSLVPKFCPNCGRKVGEANA